MPEPADHVALLRLAVETDSEPIRGELCGPDGLVCRFRGWIELTNALEHAHHPRDLTRHDTSPRGPHQNTR